MAEPPSSEGRPKPPPVPGKARAASTPPPVPKGARARSASVGPGEEEESTNRISAPNNAAVVEQVIEILAAEVEALVTSSASDSDVMLSDLSARLALFYWDVLEDVDAAQRHLDLADKHPLAPPLTFSYAVEAASAERMDAAQEMLQASAGTTKDGARRLSQALCRVAEAWLYRFGDAQRAADVARGALDGAAAPADLAELRFLLKLSLSLNKDWNELGTVCSEAAALKGAKPSTVAEAVHVLVDRAGDLGTAADLLSADLTRKLAAEDASAVYHVLAIGLELLESDLGESYSISRADLLARQLAVLTSVEQHGREIGLVRFLLAEALSSSENPEGAHEHYEALAAGQAGADDWGPRLAQSRRAQLSRAAGDWQKLADILCVVGDGGGPLGSAYVRRAAELLDVKLGDANSASELWRKLLGENPEDEQALLALERLLLGPMLAEDADAGARPRQLNALIGHLQAVARSGESLMPAALRRAAAVAESLAGDAAQAVRLRVASMGMTKDVATKDAYHGYWDLIRLHRAEHDRDRLATVYAQLAESLGKEDKKNRCKAALLCASGAVELSRGRLGDTEKAFVSAAKLAPKDSAARVALSILYRKSSQWKELAAVLEELSNLLVSDANRMTVLRELGDLYASRLNDGKRARAALAKVLKIDDEDAATLAQLAGLHEKAKEWDKAVELRAQAVTVSADPDFIYQLHMDIGRLEETQRRNDAAALQAYAAAFEADATNANALRAQAQIYRRLKNGPALLEILRAELELVAGDTERTLQLQLEIAPLAAEGDGDAALGAYLSALEVDPHNSTALLGVDRMARAGENWGVLAGAYRKAPKTEANLGVLAEALFAQEHWGELAEVRIEQLDLTESVASKAKMAADVAQTYEEKLSDTDQAIAMYQRALGFDPSSTDSQRALSRLLEQGERWPELAVACEQELSTVPATQVDRQVALLMRLGELRRDRLTKPGDAALAYESVLERRAHHIPALEALEVLYERLDREKDLLRVLEGRAEATDDLFERSQLYSRIAQVREKRNDWEGAVQMYQAAFSADPSNRETFTAMEKLAYKHERWNEAMELYDTAIKLVEDGSSRAYRLGDLYARRGQVQLQYLHELGEAAASYLRVIELDPDNDTALKFLESIFSQQGDWHGLIKAYEMRAEFAKDDDRRLDTLRRAARVAGAKLKDPAEAARIYELILKVDASDREALDALERFHERAQDWDKLVEVLKKRLASAPAGDAATALLKRVAQICEEGLRDEERAIEHYLRILEIAPGNKEALEALGRIYESTEQWAEFIDVTRRQIRITTERNVKALLYFKCGSVMESKFRKEEDAIRYYDAAIKTSPSCLPAVHGLRDLYRRREDWPRVIQTLELEVKLWQDDKERAGVFAQIGRIYSNSLEQPERAMHYFESALAVDPECLPANRALFEHYFKMGEWAQAQPLAQALSQKAMREGDPTQRAEFYRKRGIVAQMTGDLRGAAESLVISLEIKPTNLETLDALGSLASMDPLAYGFEATYRELEKIYRKRDDCRVQLGRVRVAQAVMKERDGDLDAAEKLYAEANELSPNDFAIMSALVTLHTNMRRWTHALDALVRFIESKPPPPKDVRIAALMRQAEVHADCELDPHRAVSVLKEVIRLDSAHQEAAYRLAQELYLLGRYDEARTAIERVIQLAAAPGTNVSPEALARYYYYLGRIIEQGGDARGATSRYRRAAEYDPGYAPPVLALAKRAADSGDQRQGETLLINAAHAAMESGGAQAAVPLQRGLARILLTSGDRAAAIEAYRGILAVEPDGATDRVALAEIYAIDDLPKAISELNKVVERDIRHAPAYRMLASFYARTSETERASRVLSAMEMLGYAEDADRGAAAKARAGMTHTPLRREIDDDLREQLLVTENARGPFGELFSAISGELTSLFPAPTMGENLVPVQTIEDPALKVALADLVRLFGIEPEIYIGENVPGAMVALTHPRKIIVLDRALLTENDAARRFLISYALDGIRGAYTLLFALGQRRRIELGSLLKSLLHPEAERAGPTNDFVHALPKRATKLIDRLVGKGRGLDPEIWMDDMLRGSRRAGLFGCDDFVASTRMIARLSGESPSLQSEGSALGAIFGGPDLVRFYLSDEYHRVREILSNPVGAPEGAAPEPAQQPPFR